MGAATSSIRNIAISGHGGTGKTTLVEHILAAGNVIQRPEPVENGKTVSDWTEEEIAHQISIRTSVSHIEWKGAKINLLDTPGSSDFVGEVLAAFHVAESALVVVGADAGVQIETIKIWRRLEQLGKPRMVFINKMDREHADFDKTLADLRERFSANFFPVVVPIGNAAGFRGVVDVLEQKAVVEGQPTDIPTDMGNAVEEHRMALMEAAAEGNDSLMEKYLETESLTDDDIRIGLREALAEGKVVPVFAGAGLSDSGLQSLLDFVASSAPAPGGESTGKNGEEEVKRALATDQPLSCFVYRTAMDQFSGKLSYVKVLSGNLTSDADIINYRNGNRERISKHYTCQGKKLEETGVLEAGDLGILVKLDSVETSDSIGDPAAPIQYPRLSVPQPVHSVAITAENKKDEDKLNQTLLRAAQEDPTITLFYNKETKESVLSSMGELQQSIILEGIKEHQKIVPVTKVPRVAYRETITKSSAAEHQHKKQTGGHGQYARVSLEIRPIERGKYFEFVNAIFGGAISKGYVAGVEKGVLSGMDQGVLANYPVVDLEAKIVDGKEHPVDSSEMAFMIAARGALRDAMAKAGPALLEPVMDLEVMVDDHYLGDVLSDLSSRRGRVLGQEPIGGGIQLVKAQVPQSELLRYSIDLKSMTSGTASFELKFNHYNPISGKAAEDVIKAAKAEAEADS